MDYASPSLSERRRCRLPVHVIKWALLFLVTTLTGVAAQSECNLTSSQNQPIQQLGAFNGIFLNDFTSSITANLMGAARSYGPIAVGNNLYAPGYFVADKTNLTACTPNTIGFAQYGLAVGGSIINGGTPKVTGNVYVSGTGTATLQLPSCSVRKLINSQQFDFAAAKTSYLQSSEYLSKLLPNLRMNSTFALSSVGPQADPLYNVITLNTCGGPVFGCFGASSTNPLSNLLSNPGMIVAFSGYKGPTSGTKWPNSTTLVINVPMNVGSTLLIDSDTPSAGIDSCRTIWNIYPVNGDVSYTAGSITMIRRTNQLKGLILAPNAAILDGGSGNFAGLLVSNNYNYFKVLTSLYNKIATISIIILNIVDPSIIIFRIVTQRIVILGITTNSIITYSVNILGIITHGIVILSVVIGCIVVSHLEAKYRSAFNLQLSAFNGIFLNDFTSSITANLFGQAGSYGPIAVGNNLYAPGYLVAEKTNLTACTPDTSGFAQYGLAVGGSIINGGTPKVTGNVYVSGTGTATLQLPSCSVKKLINSQQFDFASAKTSYLQASEYLAKLIPNLRMNSTFALSSLGTQADPQYNVITLNTCLGPILGCFGASFTGNLTGLLSTAGAITNLSGYKGPTAGTKWPSGATLVINVPVAVGAALEIDSDTPSVGTDPCQTIWNIYAVNIDGSHTNGPITLSRNTRLSLQGLILAPNAATLDGPTGNFAGLLVSNNYNWQTSNVNILDFSTASGGVCKSFLGCVPNQNVTSTSTISSLPVSKTASSNSVLSSSVLSTTALSSSVLSSSILSSSATFSATSKSNLISSSRNINGGSSGTVSASAAASSPSVIQACDLSKSIDLPSLQLSAFNAIFFNDFTSSLAAGLFGSSGSNGPIAVGNNLFAPDYPIAENTNLTACTPNASGFAQYGLVVGGSIINGGTPIVKGDVYLSGTGTATLKLPSCSIRKLNDSQQFDFAAAKTSYLKTSEYLAKLIPNLRMNTAFALSSLGAPADPNYNVITLNTCLGPIIGCFGASFNGNLTGLLSTAGIITNLSGYKGPTAGTKWPSGATLVINVPVVVGSTLVIDSDTPSIGTDPCRTIWNIYAVNIDGSYTNGPIALTRSTKQSLQGFILAPNAAIFDGPLGNFAGLLVSNNYNVQTPNADILDFTTASQGVCKSFLGCVLTQYVNSTSMLSSLSVSKTISSSSALSSSISSTRALSSSVLSSNAFSSSVLSSTALSSSALSTTALSSSVSLSAASSSVTSKSNEISPSSGINGGSSVTVSASAAASSPSVIQACDLSKSIDLPSLQLAAFNGIFLNDFTSSITANLFGQAGSYGPIAVGNNLYAPGYLVAEKTNLTACTPDTSGFAQYGLAVGGSIINGGTPKVTGNVYVSGMGTATLQLPSCSVKKLINSQQFDFASAKTSYLQASEYLAKLTPNLRMNSTFALSSLGTQADPQYNVVTLNTCLGPILGCFGASFTGNLTGLLSTAGVITNLSGYKGPTAGTKWPSGATLVINVPVAVGAALEIDSDTPSAGTDPCRTIWNIYAVNIDGSHTNGPITLSRNTRLSLQGLILAPNAATFDGPTGNFAGLLVSNNYNWQTSNVDILDFTTASGGRQHDIIFTSQQNSIIKLCFVIFGIVDHNIVHPSIVTHSIVNLGIFIHSITIFSSIIVSFIVSHFKVKLTSSTAASSPSVEQACDLSKSLDLPSLQLAAFNGIFLNDFTSSITANLFGQAGSYGPIAVGNNLYAPGYLVAEKTNLTACTLNASGFAQYGLAVGGSIINGGTPKVTGNVYVSGTGTATLQLPSCSVRKLIDSQQFDFAAAKTSYLQASEHLAKLIPNLRLNSTFALSSLGTQAELQYNVITLNTCNGPILGCFGASFTGNLTGLLSTAGVITNLSGYKGPTAGTKWPSGGTLVINVPVVVGTTLVIDSDTPSVGIDPCRTIWNIYPVNIDGSHTNGPIILSRNTRLSLQGLILAPNAAILDGPTGNFAGLLVSNNYNWEAANVDILDFSTASGGVCKSFLGCVPNQNATTASMLSSLSVSKTVSSSSAISSTPTLSPSASSSPASLSVTSKSNVMSTSSDINGGSSGTVTASTTASSPSVTQACDLSKSIDLPSLQLSAFNGIFLNDFTSSITANLFGTSGSYGPIAVGNNLYAPGYLIAEKTNLTACTPNASGFSQYGLAVGGSIINGGTPKVTGNVYVSGTGTATLQLPSCSVRKLIDSQQFDFAAAKTSYLQASEHLAKLVPNLRLDISFSLSSLGTQADPQYNVITLNTCNGPILGCFGASFTGNLTGLLSTAGVITNVSGYKGPTAGTKWPSGATLVINVPVLLGATLVIDSDTPSVGIDPCRTIWNIYAVNIDGSHTNGPIILSRNTKLSLQGLILAPNAAILDGPTGNFAGLLVSNNYNWEVSNVDILDFTTASGGLCKSFLGCVPNENTTSPSVLLSKSPAASTSNVISTSSRINSEPSSSVTSSTAVTSPSVTQTCDLSKSFDLPSLQLAAFNGIFLNDFTSSITANLFGQAGSYGPIAVGNNLYAPGYLVAEKTNLTACTLNASGFAQYGLAVGGSIINGGTPKVTGNVYVSGTGTATLQLPSCSVRKLIDSQQFDFAAAKASYLQASEHLAKLIPNLRLNSTFALSSLGTQAELQYNVITLNTCNGPILGCFGASFTGNLTGLLSTAGVITNLSGYKGTTAGTKWPSGATLVINVPVVVGTTLVIDCDTPSVGIDPCRTIWNIYPVNIDGSHTNGPIILSRNTRLSLQGLILAPNAAVLDGPTGNFAGLLVSNNYKYVLGV
ncbi:hypothetical protein INT44_002191 [Umbelopsis vinacea]|uniref:Choice-of-anchor A domain-containing protein n=1 Tax=Umbelopsis vinacea TaxID=44442 RepID=A0A8H7Q4Y4_9FUNG|nr:hypothetical protein INT44_002191 [Umbelopsis vinacea]